MPDNHHEVAEAVLKILVERYGMPPHRVVDAVKWVEERMAINAESRKASTTAVIGIVIAALLMALWTGVKDWIRP